MPVVRCPYLPRCMSEAINKWNEFSPGVDALGVGQGKPAPDFSGYSIPSAGMVSCLNCGQSIPYTEGTCSHCGYVEFKNSCGSTDGRASSAPKISGNIGNHPTRRCPDVPGSEYQASPAGIPFTSSSSGFPHAAEKFAGERVDEVKPSSCVGEHGSIVTSPAIPIDLGNGNTTHWTKERLDWELAHDHIAEYEGDDAA